MTTTSYEPTSAELWLYTELIGDAALDQDAPNRVYNPEPPQGAAYPLVVFWPLMGQYTAAGTGARQSAQLTYVVEAMCPLTQPGGPAALDRLAARIALLLDGRKATLGDGTYLSTTLIAPWQRSDDLYGERLLRRGAVVQAYVRAPAQAVTYVPNALSTLGGLPRMALTGTLKLSVTALGATETYTITKTAEGGDLVPVTIPAATTDQLVEAAFSAADAQLLVLGAKGGDLVVKSNGTSVLSAPSTPGIAHAATGGTVDAGTYGIVLTYVNAQGETVASTADTETTTGSTSTVTISDPGAAGSGAGAATGWYAYVTQAGGTTYYRQQPAGSPTPIGTDLTLTAPPTTTGAPPPAINTALTVRGDVLSIKDQSCIVFATGGSFVNPFHTDVAKFYVTNAGSVASVFFFVCLNTRTS